MKIIIKESRTDELILKYLEKHYSPDAGWGPDLFELFQWESEKYGWLEFEINNRSGYVYLSKDNGVNYNKPNTLLIQPWLGETLDALFDERWKQIFINWFENNTDLNVEHLMVKTR